MTSKNYYNDIKYAPDEEVKQEVIQQLKSRGIFDKMRRECLADINSTVNTLLNQVDCN